MSLPKVAITIGDPAGIGPEVVYKALFKREIFKVCAPVVIGDFSLLKNFGYNFNKIPCRQINIPAANSGKIKPGKVTATAGDASYWCILKAVELARARECRSIVTAPISKEAINSAGHKYSGHTELLAKLTKTTDFAMLMAAGNYRAVMVTRHLPLIEISRNLTVKNICKTTELCYRFLKEKAGITKPRIGVLALNPHAGEHGLLGNEEEDIIIPAVKKLVTKGIKVQGPLPCDSAWLKNKNGAFDLLVAMYHDQAMTGLKLLCPESLVNVTLGLPFLRTSPGHGTAFDIAGKNIADPAPMIESIIFAAKFG